MAGKFTTERRDKTLSSLTVTTAPPRPLEDPLAHLPCSTILGYRKGQIIYSRGQPSTNIYLVIDGKVKICRQAEDGRQVVVDIYGSDEFFGESAFLGPGRRGEISQAIEDTKLMTWTTTEIEEISARRHRLAIAFLQLLAKRSRDFESRIEDFSLDDVPRRLASALIRFAERLGNEPNTNSSGSVEIMLFTQELLSQYVGCRREAATKYMNRFRRQGYLNYSRKGMVIHLGLLKEWLKKPGSPTAF